jgi:hypothetical protein
MQKRNIIAISIVTAVIIAIVIIAIMLTTVIERTLPFLDKPSLTSSFDRLELSKGST